MKTSDFPSVRATREIVAEQAERYQEIMNDTTYYVFAIKATRKPTLIIASKDLNACKNVASQHYDVWRTLHAANLAYTGISFQVFDKPIHETVEIGAGDVKPVYQVGGY